MDSNSKIYVAGHRGLVGSALMRELTKQGYTNLVTTNIDLRDIEAVTGFFALS